MHREFEVRWNVRFYIAFEIFDAAHLVNFLQIEISKCTKQSPFKLLSSKRFPFLLELFFGSNSIWIEMNSYSVDVKCDRAVTFLHCILCLWKLPIMKSKFFPEVFFIKAGGIIKKYWIIK